MIWYGMGVLLILHAFLWGWGMTLLILPGRWRRFWPAFCAPVGLALQSALVWAATHTSLPGTDSYARASLVLPVALAVAALIVRGPADAGRLLAQLRRWWMLALVMACSLTLQTYPFTKPPAMLTSIAMTSCDAADYAVGARVLKEFAHGERTGYLGVAEPAGQLGVNNFYDFWLRINHFSPSALIAQNASVFNRPPYELVTLFGIVLVTLQLPGVFWLARSGFRFGQLASLAVTFIYGVSPSVLYAVYQVALGQLLAAPAIALLTWVGVQAFRGTCGWRRLAGYSGLILTGNWLVLGSYNFFMVFAYVPLLTYVGLITLIRGRWSRAARWAAFVGTNAVVCGALAPERVISVARRFLLFNKTPFGWPIAGFYPSGWFGAFKDFRLNPTDNWELSVAGYVGLGAVAAAMVWQKRRDAKVGWLAAACTLPVLAGYWWLLREDHLMHDNSSYDAYKLFAVFYPGILISLCLWVQAAGRATMAVRVGATVLWAALFAVNIYSDRFFNDEIRYHGIRVDRPLREMARVETLPEVHSINVRLTRYWDRLWSNYFLLRKPQFFSLPTYEGRPVTAPLGQWDLEECPTLLPSHPSGEKNLMEPNIRYRLLDHRANHSLIVGLDTGWYELESVGNESWHWSKGASQIAVENPNPDDVKGVLSMALLSVNSRTLRLCTGDHCWWQGIIPAGHSVVTDVKITARPGTTLLMLDSPDAPEYLPGDTRPLTFAVYSLQIEQPTN